MENKKNIGFLKDCYGCGVCVLSCPVNIISIKENNNGFYEPSIEIQDKCINCGLCLKVCAFNHRDVAQQKPDIRSFAGWSKNPLVRDRCSSGGIAFEIGKKLIENGFYAIGVRYDVSKNRAEHYIATTVEDFMPSVGSKYIPSFMAEALNSIDKTQKYIVTGTPCQIDSVRRYVRQFKLENNFILLDFFCHGVPSLLLWDKYTEELQSKIGDLEFVSWRNKTSGWHDSWSINADAVDIKDKTNWHDSYNLKIKEKKHLYSSKMSEGDFFYKFFLENFCLNKCCYSTCKYKMINSAADIRVGDLWGKKYASNHDGVSSVLVFTDKGMEIISSLKDVCDFTTEKLDIATEGQMKRNALKPRGYWLFNELIHNKNLSLKQISRIVKLYCKFMSFPSRLINRILRTVQ